MDNLIMPNEQPPTRMVAGALAYLAKHMETDCPRAAYLAAMLLEQVASDSEADPHLREHARELFEILERDPVNDQAADVASARRSSSSTCHPFASECAKVAT